MENITENIESYIKYLSQSIKSSGRKKRFLDKPKEYYYTNSREQFYPFLSRTVKDELWRAIGYLRCAKAYSEVCDKVINGEITEYEFMKTVKDTVVKTRIKGGAF
jgi:hypothetical protein